MTKLLLTLDSLDHDGYPIENTPSKFEVSGEILTDLLNQVRNFVRVYRKTTQGATKQNTRLTQSINALCSAAEAFDMNMLALDAENTPIEKGDTVLCIDNTEQGDSDSDFNLTKNKLYVVNDVFFEEASLLSPMIVLDGNQNGPLFSHRFIKVVNT